MYLFCLIQKKCVITSKFMSLYFFLSRHEWRRKGQSKGTDKRERKYEGNGKYTSVTEFTQGYGKGCGHGQI